MNDYIQKYIDQGYSIFPCKKKDKSPLTINGFYNATNDLNTINKQFYKDDLLIGFPTGQKNKIVVIDFDINKKIPKTEYIDPRSADELIEFVKDVYGNLPDTFSVETQSGGRHLYYSLPEGVELRSGSRFLDELLSVDIRAEGGYVIVPDGIMYTVYDDVDELDISNLQERCSILPQWVVDVQQKKNGVFLDIDNNKEENLPESEIREIRSALSFISSDNRDDWIRVGLALKSTGSPSGYGLWNEWSKTSNKYNPNDMEKRWDGLKPNEITIASLFQLSKQSGWVTTYEKVTPPPIQEIIQNDYSDPERIKKIQQKYKKKPFPEEFFQVNGLVGDLINYILEKSLYRQPIFALSASLCAVGTLAGRKVRTEDNARTNIYCLNVGSSGAGKETARKYIKEIFEHANCSNLCKVSKVSSDAAIETYMYETNSQLFPIDEVGRFLEAATNKRAPAYLTKIVDVFMELYSQADQTYTCKAYADKEREKKIEQPNLCILGTTVPKKLYEEGLSYDSATDGFLSRMLIFESDDKILKKQRNRDLKKKPPIEIIDQVTALLKKPINMYPSGNIDLSPEPQIVKKTENAQKLLDDYDDYIFDLKNSLDENGQIFEMFTRTSQTAEQIALIVSVGTNIDNPIITKKEMGYGIKLSQYLSEHMQYIIENFIARNETEHELKKILKIIRTAGSISHEEISREMQHLKSYEANDILSKLSAQNRIQQQVVGEGEFSRVMITAK